MADIDGTNVNAAIDTLPMASKVDHPQQSSDPPLTNAALNDSTLSKRPRDSRLIHMILAHYGCASYQERVPLQLMDYAYRYTSSTLQDALHFTHEGYGTAGPSTGTGVGKGGGGGGTGDGNVVVGLSAVRLAIHSRTHYQYSPTLPKEVMMDIAQERNRIGLPAAHKEFGGMRLPPEQYLLTGQGWQLAEEFDIEDVEDMEIENDMMQDQEGSENGDVEVEGGTMEDIFGSNEGGGGNAEMQDQ
ncbi:MAG: hypothetical protein Q9164_000332 [Protoblastenia rupestris]